MRFLCGDVHLGCQELFQARSFQLLHLKKFYPKFEVQFPPNCGGSNGDGTSLFWNLELHGKESAVVYRKIAHDLAATYSEVIYDPYSGMIALESSREFHLITNMMPLFPHIGTFKSYPFIKEASLMRLPLALLPSQERLVGEWVVVKEIEIF